MTDLPAVGLFLRPGLGKTSITLSAVNILKYFRWQVSKVLVVAPKKVAEATWQKEAARWDHLQHLRISTVLGSTSKRIKALSTPADIYVINRENVEWHPQKPPSKNLSRRPSQKAPGHPPPVSPVRSAAISAPWPASRFYVINRENVEWLVDYYQQAWPFDMVVLDESTSFGLGIQHHRDFMLDEVRQLQVVLRFHGRILERLERYNKGRRDKLRVRVYKGTEDEDAWNNGEVDVLLVHPASCAYGLNLQAGGRHVVWYGLNWSFELNDQGNCRLYRQGSPFDKVFVHYLVVQDCEDEDVMETIRDRADTHEAVMRALKARIKKIKEETTK